MCITTGPDRQNGLIIRDFVPLGFDNEKELGKGPLNIAIDPDGTVVAIGQNIPCREGAQVVDLKGAFLSPGWIDLHTHVYDGVCDIALDPDLIGPSTGVAMLVDAGSAGEANFRGLRNYIINPRSYPIRALLNIGSIGCTAANRVSEIGSFECIDYLRSLSCIEENRDIIRGIKVRASKILLKDTGNYPVIIAKRLAEQTGLPLVVHIGEPPVFLEELILNILGSGDVITHIYHGKAGTSLLGDYDKVLKLYQIAAKKGIRLDVGHGAASFSSTAARRAISDGLKPYTISTDLHSWNYRGPVWSLATVMSKMLAVGLDLSEVISMVTSHPASILSEKNWDTLQVGQKTALTGFTIKEGEFKFLDSAAVSDTTGTNPKDQNEFVGTTLLSPEYTIIGSTVYESHDPFQDTLDIHGEVMTGSD